MEITSLGLTKNESEIYLFLLRNKKSNVTTIAKRTGIHRRSVYDVLMRLADKSLVSYIIEDKVKIYIPSNPETLKTIIEEKEKSLKQILPELTTLFNQKAKEKSTEFFMGKKGIRSILEAQLKQKSEILVLGGNPNAQNFLLEYFPRYNLLRKERKIPIKIIYSQKEKAKPKKIPLSKIKYFPEKTGGDIAINIFGDSVALLMWNLQNPFAILINEKEVADSFRSYFEFIWKKL